MPSLSYHLNDLQNKLPVKRICGYDPAYNAGSVFCLHRVIENDIAAAGNRLNDFIEISEGKLQWVLETLLDMGVDCIGLQEVEQRLKLPTQKYRPFVHFSFDDGYLDNYTLAFPLFKKYGIPFSIFPTASFISNSDAFIWWYLLEGLLQKGANLSWIMGDGRTDTTQDLRNQFSNFAEIISEIWRSYGSPLQMRIMEMCRELDIDSPKMMEWAHLQQMLQSGLCEVGGHCEYHYKLNALPIQERLIELSNGLNSIKKHLGIDTPFLAFPFGGANDIGPTIDIQQPLEQMGIRVGLTTQKHCLNASSNLMFLPRTFINDSSTLYSLKVRINGFYFKS